MLNIWERYRSTYPARSTWLIDTLVNCIMQHPDCKAQFPKNCCDLVIDFTHRQFQSLLEKDILIVVNGTQEIPIMIGDREQLEDVGYYFKKIKRGSSDSLDWRMHIAGSKDEYINPPDD